MNESSSEGIVTGDYLLNMEKLTITKSNNSSETKENSINIKDGKNKPKLPHSPSPKLFKLENEDLRITDGSNKN
jgi:hypothetical protein